MPNSHFRVYAELGDRFQTVLNEFQLMTVFDFAHVFRQHICWQSLNEKYF